MDMDLVLVTQESLDRALFPSAPVAPFRETVAYSPLTIINQDFSGVPHADNEQVMAVVSNGAWLCRELPSGRFQVIFRGPETSQEMVGEYDSYTAKFLALQQAAMARLGAA